MSASKFLSPCKTGYYEEHMTGTCEPCSRCCNDGNDIRERECEHPAVPKSKQCSALKTKCSKAMSNASESTTAFPEGKNHSASPVPVSTPVSMRPAKHLASTSAFRSPSNGVLIAVGVPLVVLVLVLVMVGIYYFWRKKHKQQVHKKGGDDDIEMQQAPGEEESMGSSVDAEPLNADRSLSEKLPVEESDPTSPGTEETQPPGYHSTGKPLGLVMSYKTCRRRLIKPEYI